MPPDMLAQRKRVNCLEICGRLLFLKSQRFQKKNNPFKRATSQQSQVYFVCHSCLHKTNTRHLITSLTSREFPRSPCSIRSFTDEGEYIFIEVSVASDGKIIGEEDM